MPDREKLEDLLRRVEEASGPDREIDCLLHVTLHRWKLAKIGSDYDGANACEIYTETGKPLEGFGYPPRGSLSPFYHVPSWPGQNNYTASVDAALALAERLFPEHTGYVGIGKSKKKKAVLGSRKQHPADTAEAYAATPALAIVSALLRAHLAKLGDTDA